MSENKWDEIARLAGELGKLPSMSEEGSKVTERLLVLLGAKDTDELLAEGGPVNRPKHYTSSPAKCLGCGRTIDCADVNEHMPTNFGTAVKYVWRNGLKVVEGEDATTAAIRDLEKAKWYIGRQIELLKRGTK